MNKNILRENAAKKLIRSGQIAFGPIIQAISSPSLIRLLSRTGFDYVYLDMEHGLFDYGDLTELCQVCGEVGIVPIVRTASQQPDQLTRVLDGGAMGLLVPHIDTGEQASSILRSIKYYPQGQRGFSGQGAHTGYQKISPDEYMAWANREIMVGFLIESTRGIQELEKIVSQPGIDFIVVGRCDLAQDMGIPGQMSSPMIEDAVSHCFEICRKHCIATGILVYDHESALKWIKLGVQMLNYCSDISIFTDLLKHDLHRLREASYQVQ